MQRPPQGTRRSSSTIQLPALGARAPPVCSLALLSSTGRKGHHRPAAERQPVTHPRIALKDCLEGQAWPAAQTRSRVGPGNIPQQPRLWQASKSPKTHLQKSLPNFSVHLFPHKPASLTSRSCIQQTFMEPLLRARLCAWHLERVVTKTAKVPCPRDGTCCERLADNDQVNKK